MAGGQFIQSAQARPFENASIRVGGTFAGLVIPLVAVRFLELRHDSQSRTFANVRVGVEVSLDPAKRVRVVRDLESGCRQFEVAQVIDQLLPTPCLSASYQRVKVRPKTVLQSRGRLSSKFGGGLDGVRGQIAHMGVRTKASIN